MHNAFSLMRADLRTLYKTSRTLFFVCIIYQLAYSFIGNEVSFLSTSGIAVVVAFVCNSITYDEKSGWNRFVLTTAYSRADYVHAKYLLAVCILLAELVVNFLCSLLAIALGTVTPENSLLAAMPLLLAVGLIFPTLLLPPLLKFGMEKARLIYLLMIVLLGSSIGIITAAFGETGSVSLSAPPAVSCGIALAVVLLFLLSSELSVRIYQKKQL